MKRNLCYGTLAALLLALVCFTFFDLEISHLLYAPENGMGIYFALTGDSPLYILLSFAGTLLLFLVPHRILRYSGLLLVMLGLFFGAYKMMGHGSEIAFSQLYLAYPITILECALGVAMALLCRKRLSKEGLSVILAIIAAVALSLIITNLLKIGIGRLRYREMIALGNFEGYTPWFIPHFRSAGESFKSFPSGHTGAGAYIFVLWFFPSLLAMKSRVAKALLYVIPLVYTALLAVSRIIMGAHFATDTIFAVIITLGCFLLADVVRKRILDRRGKRV